MADFILANELDDDIGDFDAGASTNSDNDKVDSSLIKKILCEMKSEFNRGIGNIPYSRIFKDDIDDPLPESASPHIDSIENGFVTIQLPFKKDDESNDDSVVNEATSIEEAKQSSSSINSVLFDDKESEVADEKPDTNLNDISVKVLPEESEIPKRKRVSKESPKKLDKTPEIPNSEDIPEKKGRRSLRNIEKADPELGLKRSSRRMSKEYSRESVLQNAIARKEKSFSSLNPTEEKHRRSSRLSDEKSAAKTRSSIKNKSKSTVETEVLSSEVINENVKVLNGKTSKVSLNEVDTDNELKKATKFDSSLKISSLPNSEHASEDDLPNNFQPENDWEKGTDSSSNISSNSFQSKKIKYPFSNDQLQPPVKRLKTNSSPVPPEASEAPQYESDVPLMAWVNGVCECLSDGGLYPSKGSISTSRYCRALDTFESRIIGCCSQIDENTPLLRPSKTIPMLLMCQVHIERLKRHNCCPTCGLFCTQGNFYQCKDYHFFHKECELKRDDCYLCPHCASEDFIEVKLTLGSHQYPVFLPMQKPPNKIPLARITLNHTSFRDFDEKDEEEVKVLIPPKDLTFNRKKISIDGIPSVEKEKYSQRAFYQACKNGDAEKLLSMLSSTNFSIKDTSSLMALHAAAGNGHLAVVHILVQAGSALESLDKSQYTPLMLAALNGHNNVVKYLIKAGADVAFKGSDGMTALHLAAKIGNLEACHYLLSAANTPLAYVDCVDDGLWTPLVWAAENRHATVVRYLLEKKADPQLRDSEMNIALHWSAFSGSMEITEDLLNYGSAINLCNAHGDTPLHIAARQAADNCVMLLLARGARSDITNKAGQLARDCVLLESSYCKTAIELNMKIASLVKGTIQYPRILSNDVSKGNEVNPIQCINNIDEEPQPRDFTYITENCITSNLSIDRRITTMTGCRCEDMCTTASCMCSRISLRCWYDNRGKLLPDFNFKDPPMIFECNQTCECNAITCKNRVVQRGLKAKLQVCRTKYKEWGVITLKEIPKGTYVCEYIGEIISDCEADTREDDSYLFDLDNRDGESYCIDACRYGNVTRFVNHSCKPNLVPVRVFIGHHDLHFPRIAFFAARDIAPNEELGFDYGEKFWIIKCKKFTCACEEESCRYSSTTIHETLEKYKEKIKLEESL
ncbi:histone-lysine N-methyltransferase EHMT2 isoform X2 [Halyomorpha halys]|uniref:histone-lysine N-methyltransferase EHMT2 isoform X2 n=1 Tax=Halyomorpha halys TaxID=286706 RepID=UPI0006D4FC0C|nr:histone-lysine N-methyltransferase EHMT2 isoform X2 [Halyomorpha halys]